MPQYQTPFGTVTEELSQLSTEDARELGQQYGIREITERDIAEHTVDTATVRQFDLITKLIKERESDHLVDPDVQRSDLTKVEASNLIKALFEQNRRPVAKKTDAEAPVGFYTHKTATPPLFAKVIPNSDETFTYARLLDTSSPLHKGQRLNWLPFPGGKFLIAKRDSGWLPLTAEQASEFGRITESCIFCSRTLTDDRSKEVGYGKKCAQNHDLPWG